MLEDRSDFMRRGDNSVFTMTLMEPGKKRLSVPIFPGDEGHEEPVAQLIGPYASASGAAMALAPLSSFGKDAHSAGLPPDRGSFQASLPPDRGSFAESLAPSLPPQRSQASYAAQRPADIFKTATPAEWAQAESFRSQSRHDCRQERQDSREDRMHAGYDAYSMPHDYGTMPGALPVAASFSHMYSASGPGSAAMESQQLLQAQVEQDMMENDIMEWEIMDRTLREKKELLDEALQRYGEVADQLRFAQTDERLLQWQAEVEIEAAGYQAEVAVLSQALNDLDDALRSKGSPHLR